MVSLRAKAIVFGLFTTLAACSYQTPDPEAGRHDNPLPSTPDTSVTPLPANAGASSDGTQGGTASSGGSNGAASGASDAAGAESGATGANPATGNEGIVGFAVTPAVSFVIALYNDVLARPASGDEVAYWVNRLNTGASRATVGSGFLESTEGKRDDVDQIYRAYLLRPAEEGGLAYWSPLADRDIQVGVLASSEYYASRSASNVDTLIRNSYRDVLKREASNAEVLSWLDNFPGQAAFEGDVVDSPEHHLGQVSALYVKYLGRAAGGPEQTYWATMLDKGTPVNGVASLILASDEYYARASARFH